VSVSLDGFVARTDGVIDWLSEASTGGIGHGDRRHRATLELLGHIGTIVQARHRAPFNDGGPPRPESQSVSSYLRGRL
jgi:hypothetical protein